MLWVAASVIGPEPGIAVLMKITPSVVFILFGLNIEKL
jgi:hypothetical protein